MNDAFRLLSSVLQYILSVDRANLNRELLTGESSLLANIIGADR